MKIGYRINRFIIRQKLKRMHRKETKALSMLTLEQKRIYNLIRKIVKENNSAIRFDLKTDEILIILPHLLIILKNYKVSLLNTNDSHMEEFPPEAYEPLVDFIILEGHRHRRKLKQDVKIRINKFLDSLDVLVSEPINQTEL